MLNRVRKSLSPEGLLVETSGPYTNQAAVLVALTNESDDPNILLTKRAEHLSSHSGEVSFPGGKWEDNDENLLITALRESEEEIGLNPDSVEMLASLKPRLTRGGMKVTPFVGIVPSDIELIPNPGELDAIFRVPISFFLADQRIRTDLYQFGDREFWAPAYHFDGFEIWGFTAKVLVSLLNQVFQAGINLENPAPLKVYN